MNMETAVKDIRIAVIGLGYVGLPLAAAFAKKYPVTGFDVNESRVNELCKGHDHTLELVDEKLQAVLTPTHPVDRPSLFCTANLQDISQCNFYIITVPTPVDENKQPDLSPLYKASETVARIIKKGDTVVYESTVYPGATEEECIPIIEKISGLHFNTDFFAGYSPERINPGDKEHTVEYIKKVTSGSTPETALKVDAVYRSVIIAGTHMASCIKVAEAAKVIENTQRDINIAFMNELSKIFSRIGISTYEVLEAAGTKWNFLKFYPGLVGGHCIGVDPYYLSYKANALGYHAQIINAGRAINDSMGAYVARMCIKKMVEQGINIAQANILIMGATFKENVPDIRNTRIIDIYKEFNAFGLKNVSITDPLASPVEFEKEYHVALQKEIKLKYHAIVLAVPHQYYLNLDLDYFQSIAAPDAIFYDVKGVFKNKLKDMTYLSL
jgi:UDP-N-acetyl-D-glucosamine/UDP-N-acetyl-D-galactosamine dehydrogenase